MGISLRAYARHRNISLAAVQKAIRSGRIRKESDGSIDPERADIEWNRNTRESMLPRSDTHREVRTVPEPPADDAAMSFQKARQMRLLYEAKMAKLEIDIREGKLVDADELNREVFNRARRVRDRLLAVPRRIGALVAAESDAAVIKEIVRKALVEALEDMASPETFKPLGKEKL